METLIKSDIFFFVTTVCVVLLTFIAIIFLFYAIKLTQHITYISKKVREESDNISADIAGIRMHVREKGMKIGSMLSTIIGMVFGFGKSKTKYKSRGKVKNGLKDED